MKSNRRRGQGMTEYIVLVGLIAIALVVAVNRYKEQVRITIEGSATAVKEDVHDEIGVVNDAEDDEGEAETTYSPTDRETADGRTIYEGSDGVDYVEVRSGVYEPAP